MKDIIKALIEKRKIKKIVYVDNEFEIDVYKNNIRLFLRENISNPSIKWPFLAEGGIDYALEECERWLNNSENSNAIIEFIKEKEIQREASPVEKKLNEILPEDILSCVTPCEFKEQYTDNPVFTPTEDQQLVILMDKYINGDDGNSGMRLLAPFENKDYVACGLFSNRFCVNDELEHWNDCNKATNIYPLSKSRVMEEDGGKAFLLGLRDVVWLRQISDIKEQAIKLLSNAIKFTINDIRMIDPASFDYAVIRKSIQEGCWEFEVLKRIIMIFLEKRFQENVMDHENYTIIQTLSKGLKVISNTPDIVYPSSTLLKELTENEVYYPGVYVNGIYSQIANGDIFEIDNKGEYMLVCQPCNLELRQDATRKTSEFVYLLPIEPINEEGKQKYISNLYQIKGENSCCVNLARAKRVCPMILDLVSYNTDGRSQLDIDITYESLQEKDIIQDNMLKQYQKIYKEILKFTNLRDKVKNSDIDPAAKSQLLSLVQRPFKLSTDKFIKINPNGNIVDFGIRRKRRYKEFYAQLILQDFMAYLSRQAYPVDIQP